MTTTVKLKNSVTTTNAPSSLQQGEVAINITDRKVWVGNAATTPVQLIGDGSSFNNLSYTGTFTGGTGIVNIGSGQFYKNSIGDIGLGTTSPNGVGSSYRNLVMVGSQGSNIDLNDSSGTVRGTISTDTSGGNALFIDTRTNHPIVFRTSTGVIERMRITSEGFVGIGTNPSAWSGSGAKVLQNDQLSLAGIAGNSYFSNNWYTDGSANRYITTAPASQMRLAENTIIFNRAASGSAGGSFSWSESMRITTAGDVGIGTTLPSGKLGISGDTPLYMDTTYGAFAFRNISTTGQELHIRPSAGKNGFISFTENAVEDRFIVGIEAGVAALLFKSGSPASNTERMRLTTAGVLQFDSGYGSVATAFGCRAWVNFNGTGTVAIRASGNVSSITDIGTADYRVNFTTAMPDENYTQVWSAGQGAGSGSYFTTTIFAAPTTSNCTVRTTTETSTLQDPAYVTLSVFR
jgi:hypothetical protein